MEGEAKENKTKEEERAELDELLNRKSQFDVGVKQVREWLLLILITDLMFAILVIVQECYCYRHFTLETHGFFV